MSQRNVSSDSVTFPRNFHVLLNCTSTFQLDYHATPQRTSSLSSQSGDGFPSVEPTSQKGLPVVRWSTRHLSPLAECLFHWRSNKWGAARDHRHAGYRKLWWHFWPTHCRHRWGTLFAYVSLESHLRFSELLLEHISFMCWRSGSCGQRSTSAIKPWPTSSKLQSGSSTLARKSPCGGTIPPLQPVSDRKLLSNSADNCVRIDLFCRTVPAGTGLHTKRIELLQIDMKTRLVFNATSSADWILLAQQLGHKCTF